MADVHYEKVNELTKGITEKNIEGVIYENENGQWFAIFLACDGRLMRVQIDCCPWCGKELAICGEHSH